MLHRPVRYLMLFVYKSHEEKSAYLFICHLEVILGNYFLSGFFQFISMNVVHLYE